MLGPDPSWDVQPLAQHELMYPAPSVCVLAPRQVVFPKDILRYSWSGISRHSGVLSANAELLKPKPAAGTGGWMNFPF